MTVERRADCYAGSIRLSSRYGSVPRRERPLIVNNVIGLQERAWPVCKAAQASIRNVILRGRPCSPTDRVGRAQLDRRGRPTAASATVIDRAYRR